MKAISFGVFYSHIFIYFFFFHSSVRGRIFKKMELVRENSIHTHHPEPNERNRWIKWWKKKKFLQEIRFQRPNVMCSQKNLSLQSNLFQNPCLTSLVVFLFSFSFALTMFLFWSSKIFRPVLSAQIHCLFSIKNQ